jgi:hypothetical protein
MRSRRNFLIRSIGTLAGDLAVGVALATACAWVIETAALGLFLSFVLWLATLVAGLAINQHVVHPAAKVLLSDRKLDASSAVVQGLATELMRFAEGSTSPAWHFLRSSFGRYAAGFGTR